MAERRNEFAIRPGYSSGASSYDGSVGGDDEDRDLRVSRHSDILALSDLRQEMVAEGDLTKTVVRIEVGGNERTSKRTVVVIVGEKIVQGVKFSVIERIWRSSCCCCCLLQSSFGQPIEDVYDGVHDGPVLGSGVSGIVRLVTHKATNVK